MRDHSGQCSSNSPNPRPGRASPRFLIALVVVVQALFFPRAGLTQKNEDVETLKKQIHDLQDGQKEIRKDLEAIRTLLANHQNPVPSDVKLSLEGARFRGEQATKVTLVEFFDYQCAFCKMHFDRTMPALTSQYIRTGKLRYVVRDFPLEPIHPQAFKAAEAARCAGDQEKFWQMHDQLMTNPQALDRTNLSLDADNFGLDIAAFDRCLDSGKYATKIQQDMADGLKAGVVGTPTFFLGVTDQDAKTFKAAQRFDGAVPFTQLKQAIDRLLAEQK